MVIDKNSTWQHKKSGAMYKVICIANQPGNIKFPITVVYENIITKAIWARPKDEFLLKFEEHIPFKF